MLKTEMGNIHTSCHLHFANWADGDYRVLLYSQKNKKNKKSGIIYSLVVIIIRILKGHGALLLRGGLLSSTLFLL